MGLNGHLNGTTSDISSRLQILLTLIKCTLLLILEGQRSVTVTYGGLQKSFTFRPKHAELFLTHKAFYNHFRPTSVQRNRPMTTESVTLKRILVCISPRGHFSVCNIGFCLKQSTSILVEG